MKPKCKKLTVLGLGNILMTDEGVGVRLMEAVRDFFYPFCQKASIAVRSFGEINPCQKTLFAKKLQLPSVPLADKTRDKKRTWPEGVEFIDGGAGGLGLLNVIERAERLVVFDAADMEFRISDFGFRIAGSSRPTGERNPQSAIHNPQFVSLPAGQFRVITPEQLLDEPALFEKGRMSMHDMPFAQTLALCRQFTRCPDDVTILAIQPADISPGRQLSPIMQQAFKTLLQAGVGLVQDKLAR